MSKEKKSPKGEKSLEERNIETRKRLMEVAERQDGKAVEKDKLRNQLSIRDRLMRRQEKKSFSVTFEDDLGEFQIKTRMMTSAERQMTFELNQKLTESESDPDLYQDAMGEFKDLAKRICITSGLEEYWEENASDDISVGLVMNTLRASIEAVGAAMTSFRVK